MIKVMQILADFRYGIWKFITRILQLDIDDKRKLDDFLSESDGETEERNSIESEDEDE